ncbi:MAG TPA: hypothetical protein GX509_08010, partial [Firmicutes bacterium]|nr:hypothetical protein [Bacillota bacterium]
ILLRHGDSIYVPRAVVVQVLGQVEAPGTYRLKAKSRVVEAIAKAGGIRADGDPSAIKVTRAGEKEPETYVVDLDEILKGRPEKNLVLEDQDIISVPELIRQVSILGEISKPGTYKLHKDMKVLDLIAEAGGLNKDGDSTHVLLKRKQGDSETTLTIDLSVLSSQAGTGNTPELRNGDIVYVPRALRIQVLGAVRAPGPYVLPSGSTLTEAIARAGGLDPKGDPTHITLTNRVPSAAGDIQNGPSLTPRVVNLEEILSRNKAQDILLADGDTIFVPQFVLKVSCLGEVARPGVFDIDKDTRLLDVIALAGGPTQQGDTSSVTVTRRSGDSIKTFTVDLDKISAGRLSGENIALQHGDTIYVPRAIAVQVMGKVRSPGLYYLKAKSRLLDAIARAGGPLDEADTSSIVFTTKSHGEDGKEASMVTVTRLVNVDGILEQGKAGDNYELADGDVIFVPEAFRDVVVVGEVARPGVYKVGKDARLMDVIAQAGGPSPRAALEAVCIFERGQVSKGQEVKLGMNNLLFQGNATSNPPVKAGDIVYVPETKKLDWDKVFSFLSGLKLIKDLIIH